MDTVSKRRVRQLSERAAKLARVAAGVRSDGLGWTVPSGSDPGVTHRVVTEAGRLVCSCPAGQHGRPCVHAAAVGGFTPTGGEFDPDRCADCGRPVGDDGDCWACEREARAVRAGRWES